MAASRSNTAMLLTRNLLANSAGSDELRRIAPMLTLGPLEAKAVLSQAGEDTMRVYFPLSGVVILGTLMVSGAIMATSVIGNEGFVGIGSYLGRPATGNEQTVVAIGGEALSMQATSFYETTQLPGRLHTAMQTYASSLLAQAVQAIACNRLHTVQQRCARWLLMLRDRTGTDLIPLTQDSLAEMLGTRRPSITQVVGSLQEQGSINLRRGSVRIIDRARLELSACECYKVMNTVGNGNRIN